MNDNGHEPASDRPEADVEQQHLSRSDSMFVRLTMWQTVLSVAGIFIGLVALYAALTESAAVRQQTAAAVWPFVQISIEDFDTGDAAGFSVSFTNAGVGPARVRGLELIVDGRPMRSLQEFVEHVGGDAAAPVSSNFISDRVLRPDERVDLIATLDPDLARRFQAVIANPANAVRFCYCSIFDECWLADSKADLLNPDPVDLCPNLDATGYQD